MEATVTGDVAAAVAVTVTELPDTVAPLDGAVIVAVGGGDGGKPKKSPLTTAFPLLLLVS